MSFVDGGRAYFFALVLVVPVMLVSNNCGQRILLVSSRALFLFASFPVFLCYNYIVLNGSKCVFLVWGGGEKEEEEVVTHTHRYFVASGTIVSMTGWRGGSSCKPEMVVLGPASTWHACPPSQGIVMCGLLKRLLTAFGKVLLKILLFRHSEQLTL